MKKAPTTPVPRMVGAVCSSGPAKVFDVLHVYRPRSNAYSSETGSFELKMNIYAYSR